MKFNYFGLVLIVAVSAFAGEFDRVEYFHPQILRSGQALILHSRGNTTVSFKWAGPAQFQIVGEGKKFSVVPNVPVVLKETGLYRLIPTLLKDSVSLSTRCIENCFHAEISPQEAWAQLKYEEMLPLVKFAHQHIKELSEDRETQKRLASGLVAHFKNSLKSEHRFPVLPPFHEIGEYQGMLGGFEAKKPAQEKIQTGDLNALLEEGKKDKLSEPSPTSKDFPEVKYGHFTDLAIPFEMLVQSPVIARVFTSLATGNGTEITWKTIDKTFIIKTPQEFVLALYETGHQIVWQSERTHANFIALVRGDKYVRWPAWVDTGIPLKDGRNLQIPMGHSQQTWVIHGPIINARIAFFLGMNGVGFFANTDSRPAWTGLNIKHQVESGEAGASGKILASFAYASKYLKRVYADLDGPAKGMPASGYGFLGVCNDSNAFIELRLFGTETTYPWVRSPKLLVPNSNSVEDSLFNKLQSDVTTKAEDLKPGGASRLKTLCRVMGMNPYSLDDIRLPDPQYGKDLVEVAAEVGNACN